MKKIVPIQRETSVCSVKDVHRHLVKWVHSSFPYVRYLYEVPIISKVVWKPLPQRRQSVFALYIALHWIGLSSAIEYKCSIVWLCISRSIYMVYPSEVFVCLGHCHALNTSVSRKVQWSSFMCSCGTPRTRLTEPYLGLSGTIRIKIGKQNMKYWTCKKSNVVYIADNQHVYVYIYTRGCFFCWPTQGCIRRKRNSAWTAGLKQQSM